jgi:hypothetical protein
MTPVQLICLYFWFMRTLCTAASTVNYQNRRLKLNLKQGSQYILFRTALASAVSGRERARIGAWLDRRQGELLVRRN